MGFASPFGWLVSLISRDQRYFINRVERAKCFKKANDISKEIKEARKFKDEIKLNIIEVYNDSQRLNGFVQELLDS